MNLTSILRFSISHLTSQYRGSRDTTVELQWTSRYYSAYHGPRDTTVELRYLTSHLGGTMEHKSRGVEVEIRGMRIPRDGSVEELQPFQDTSIFNAIVALSIVLHIPLVLQCHLGVVTPVLLPELQCLLCRLAIVVPHRHEEEQRVDLLLGGRLEAAQ